MSQIILVTGGAGFIGSAVVRQLIQETECTVINVDKSIFQSLNASEKYAHSF